MVQGDSEAFANYLEHHGVRLRIRSFPGEGWRVSRVTPKRPWQSKGESFLRIAIVFIIRSS